MAIHDTDWAMLARHYDEISPTAWPYLGQPKLEGIRSKWTGEYLITRQGNVVSPSGLPALYEKLTAWSDKNPDVILDGELYCHGMRFQDIAALCSVNRTFASPGHESIDLHAFDIISEELTEERQIKLASIYEPAVACCKVANYKEAQMWLRTFRNHGFEGLILREYLRPYIPGRTDAVIKLKLLQYGVATVLKVTEGLGKFTKMFGTFDVEMGGIKFSVGGGLINDEQRDAIWADRKNWPGRKITIQFRDRYESGRPVQPQINKLEA